MCSPQLQIHQESQNKIWVQTRKIDFLPDFCQNLDISVTLNWCQIFIPFQNLEFLIFFYDFFFQWKLRCRTFQKWKRGIKRGITGDAILVWISGLFWKFQKFQIFHTKIGPWLVPLLVPLIHFWKIWHLSFHWKKKSSKNIKNSRF